MHFLHKIKSEKKIISYYPNFFNSQKAIIGSDIAVLITLLVGMSYIIRERIFVLHKIFAYPIAFTLVMLARFVIALIFLKPPGEY